jgi:hypothetical protein
MENLLFTITGEDSIAPYSDVALRILMRIADVLMARKWYFYCEINSFSIGEEIVEKLTEH